MNAIEVSRPRKRFVLSQAILYTCAGTHNLDKVHEPLTLRQSGGDSGGSKGVSSRARRMAPLSRNCIHDPTWLFAPTYHARRRDRLRLRRRPLARGRRRRHGAPADRRIGRAGDAGVVARRQMDRLRRPRRAASGGLPDARGRRTRAAHDVAGARRPRARLDAGGPHPVRHHARAAVLPQLPRVHARRQRRIAGNAAAGPGQPSGVRARARRRSSAATPRIPRAGNAIAAAPRDICGSTRRAAATSAA